MSKEIDIKIMLSLEKGCNLVCENDNDNYHGLKYGSIYVFEGYDDGIVPENRENAVMSWYPDKPIWTPERYEIIRYEFMRVKLEGIEEPMMLKRFNIMR